MSMSELNTYKKYMTYLKWIGIGIFIACILVWIITALNLIEDLVELFEYILEQL